MRDPLGVWRLFQKALVRLLVLTIGLLIAFIALAWFNGSLKLPEFLLRSSRGAPLSVSIDVFPVDSIITFNDQPFDRNNTPLPGDYTVRVTHDKYLPAEEHVRIHPNQKNQIIIRLMPIITVQSVADHAANPGWDQEGNLFFLNLLEGKIYEWSKGTPSPVVDVTGEIYQLLYLPSGTHAITLASEGPESISRLQMINLQSGQATDLQSTGSVSLDPDGKTIWGFNYDPDENINKPIWSLEPGGSPSLLPLQDSEWAIYGDQLLSDPSGQWMVVESRKGIAVWEVSSGKMLATFENASAPVWVQSPQPGLAYLNADNSLNFARADLNWSPVLLLAGIHTPLAVVPGSSEIIFSRYNPFAGGSSFWAVDTATMGVRLLSEAKTESGRVEQFAVSLDGKKLAFINQKNVLYLVGFEP